jgi:two-component system, chemotaxis family, CheB/CheR fusion protein
VTIARHGRYRQTLSGVSPERLERWFAEEGDDYCVVKDVREMCVYSIHNLAKDPPFSKLDLISCRNLLIYFDTPLQNRLVRTFHYPKSGSWLIARWRRIGRNYCDGDGNDECGGSPGG